MMTQYDRDGRAVITTAAGDNMVTIDGKLYARGSVEAFKAVSVRPVEGTRPVKKQTPAKRHPWRNDYRFKKGGALGDWEGVPID